MTKREFERFRRVLGQRIKERRIATGLTQEQMEDEIWLSARSFQDIESGKVNPRLSSLMLICSKLNIELADLFSDKK